jgi:PAS domain S-box-containing protein
MRTRSIVALALLGLWIAGRGLSAAESREGQASKGRAPGDAKVLRIGVGRSNPPFSYVEEGKPVGYWVDLAAETATVLGYRPEIEAEVWDTVKAELAAGKLDVAASMADLPERRASYDFTVPVSTFSYGLWVRRGSPIGSAADLAGKRLVLQRGSAAADRVAAYAPGALVSLVPDDADALVLLDSGRYDAAILSLAQGLYFSRALKLRDLSPLPGPVLVLEQRFAVAKGNSRLARELDAGLNILKENGRLDEIYSKWLGVRDRALPARAPAWLLAGLALAGLLLAVSFAFVAALRRTVRRRTAELEANERKYRTLSDGIPQKIFVKDRDSRYLSCNRHYAEALGIAPEAIAGKSDYDFYPRELADEYRGYDRAAMEASGSLEVVERWPGPEGETWINTVKTAIRDGSGKVAGVIGIFWDVSDRLRLEEATRKSLEEKEVLLHEINHRVKNNLQLIGAIIRLELDQSPGPELERFVKDTSARIGSIATVQEMLYASNDLSDIRVDDYFRHLARGLMDTYSRPDRSVSISVEAEEVRLDLCRMVNLGLMANEMITNSLKYAFEGRDSGRIRIRMARAASPREFLFGYSDDGIGLPEGFDRSGRRSLGTTFIDSLARQLDGELSVRSEGGLSYELLFGAARPEERAEGREGAA